jgi:hypothetical protein
MQTLPNQYVVQAEIDSDPDEDLDEEPDEESEADADDNDIQEDNLWKIKDVEVPAEVTIGLNSTNILLEALDKDNIESYTEEREQQISELVLSAFNRIFQEGTVEDQTSWDQIRWEITKAECDAFEASGTADHFFYIQFFKREQEHWLRVHYEGPTELDIIYSTTHNNSFILAQRQNTYANYF